MKPVVLILLFMPVATLSCCKKDIAPAKQPNPYKHKVRLKEALTIVDSVSKQVISQQYKYNEDGYLARYRYVDSVMGSNTADVVKEIVYTRVHDNKVLVESQTFNSGGVHREARHHYNPDGIMTKVVYFRENALSSTTTYKWENGKITTIYLSDLYIQFDYNTGGNLEKLTQIENNGDNKYVHAVNAQFDNHVNVWTMIPGLENPFDITGPNPEYYSSNNITYCGIIGGRTASYSYEYDADGYVTKSRHYIYSSGYTSSSTTLFFYENVQ